MPIVSKNGKARVKVISPGFGSSGYYSPALLEQSAAKFANAHCYWNHPSLSEENDRPERSLHDLAGKIVGTPVWEANGATGPGIYADVQIFKHYRDAVSELAPHIGMSIRALGKARNGEIEGKQTAIIEEIGTVRSVDFVTLPGRGGEILELFEAARSTHMADDQLELEEVTQIEATKTEATESKKAAEVVATKEAAAPIVEVTRDEVKTITESIMAELTEQFGEKPSISDPTVREFVEKAAREVATAKAKANESARTAAELTERNARLVEQYEVKFFTEEVRGRSDANPTAWVGPVDDHVRMCRFLAEKAGRDSWELANYIQTNRAHAEQLKASQLFTQIGSGREPAGLGAYERIEILAKERARQTSGLTFEKAFDEVLQGDPDLRAAYAREQFGS